MVPVDYYSTGAVYLSMSFNGLSLAHGTGFFFLHRKRMFLVTARHNLSGTHWETGRNLNSQGGRPNFLKAHSWIFAQRDDQFLLGSGHHEFALHGEDGAPVWMESNDTDVAVLDLERLSRNKSLFPNADDHQQFQEWFGCERDFRDFSYSATMQSDIKIPYVNDKVGPYVPVVGQDLFIVGYPLTFACAGEFPIWKRGSIATEPHEDYKGMPLYLIDAVTREGLSGSPVIGSFVNPSFDNGGKGILTLQGTERAFAGLYTCRIGAVDDFSAQMGVVWKPSVITQIIDENWI